jgi:flagellar protein FliO/FliZ
VSLDLYTRFLLALVAVLALLAVFAWLARRFGFAGRSFAAGGRRRLAIVEVLPIDAKRRLILVRRDQTEHLIVLGSDGATVIETGIGAPGDRPGTGDTAPPRAGGFAAMIKQETDS